MAILGLTEILRVIWETDSFPVGRPPPRSPPSPHFHLCYSE